MAQVHAALQALLDSNAQWARDVDAAEPDFFRQSAKGQSPQILWIGCADSRVPESVITGARPGDIFVHRNIANQVHLDDKSVLSVLQYAVDFVGVQHVVVVGHNECGGAAACLGAAQSSPSICPAVTVPSLPAESPLNTWLDPLTRLAQSLHLSTTPHVEALPVLVEENVKRQVENLAKIRDAWTKGVWIHGWVYDIASGTLRDLGISQGPQSK